MADIYLGLGSNKGDRAANLRAALSGLPPAVTIHQISRLYESAPMYVLDQSPFYNIAIRGLTTLSPEELLRHVKVIEQQVGRKDSERSGPREIDIDILFYDDLVHESKDLVIPHPRLHERAFVIVPMEEIARFHEHPILKKQIIELWDELGAGAREVWEADERL